MIALPQLLAGVLAMTVGDVEIAPGAPIRPPRPRPRRSPARRRSTASSTSGSATGRSRSPTERSPDTTASRSSSAGCALREEWTGASGTTGTSLNMYDAGRAQVAPDLGRRRGHGPPADRRVQGRKDGARGREPGRQAERPAAQRITWTPLSGGRVRQLWDSSEDGGKTWKVEFDGTYATKNGSGRLTGRRAAPVSSRRSEVPARRAVRRSRRDPSSLRSSG